jgi:hypothetical protein
MNSVTNSTTAAKDYSDIEIPDDLTPVPAGSVTIAPKPSLETVRGAPHVSGNGMHKGWMLPRQVPRTTRARVRAAVSRHGSAYKRTSSVGRIVADTYEGFQTLDVSAMEKLPPVEWLVDGVLPAGGLAVLYGEPEVGKTFVCVDLSLSLGAGLDWLGVPALAGPVVYVSAEGSAGLPQRIEAWRHEHPTTVPPAVHFVREPVSLLDAGDTDRLLRTVRARGARLLVLDTLSRCMPGGEENWTKDMGRVVAAVDRIRHETGAAVLVIHHTIKSGTGAGRVERGSSVLRGAADGMLLLRRHAGVLHLECTKQKDAARFPTHVLQLAPVDVEGARSCVVRAAGTYAAEATFSVTAKQRHIIIALAKHDPVRMKGSELREATGLNVESTFEREVQRLRKAGLVDAGHHGYVLADAGRAWVAEHEPLTLTLISPSSDPHEADPPSPSSPSHPFRGEGEREVGVVFDNNSALAA